MEDNAFEKMKNLIEINLQNNQITEMSADFLDGLSLNDQSSNFEVLNLRENKIRKMSSSLGYKLIFIDQFYLDSEYFASILKKNQQVNDLTLFYLRDRNLFTIPTNYFKLVPNLTILYFSSNKINLIESNAFISLQNLINLYLNSNFLTKLTKAIFKGVFYLSFC